MERTPAWASGAALAVTIGVIYMVCAVASVFAPDRLIEFFNTWMHTIDLRLVKRPSSEAISAGQWVFGFVTAVLASFLAGVLYGWTRNLFGTR
jgi:ABC-type nitrate/sulfonate/bicarbonate transport system permease component